MIKKIQILTIFILFFFFALTLNMGCPNNKELPKQFIEKIINKSFHGCNGCKPTEGEITTEGEGEGETIKEGEGEIMKEGEIEGNHEGTVEGIPEGTSEVEGNSEGFSGENKPPIVSLIADPPMGSAPLQVLLTVNASDPDNDNLTYSWDFGDGDSTLGQSSILHVYTSDGDYSAKVMVSDGQHQVLETFIISVGKVTQENTEIGPEGGNVILGSCKVIVPSGLTSSKVLFSITEHPWMGDMALKNTDKTTFLPLGSGYEIETPLKSSEPFIVSLSYTGKTIPPEYPYWGVLIREIGMPVIRSGFKDPPGRSPVVCYLPISVENNKSSETVQVFLYGRTMLQLVAMSEPIITETVSLSIEKEEAPPRLMFIYNQKVSNPSVYKASVIESFNKSYDLFSTTLGMPVPKGVLKVFVGSMQNANWNGYVYQTDPWSIYLNADITDPDEIKKVFAHEYFHTIQGYSNNRESIVAYHNLNSWFYEGTASWAMDEVYDDIPGKYHSTSWNRFDNPLNKEGYDGLTEYETVSFWKWIEDRKPYIIRDTLITHQTRTHTVSGKSLIENTNKYTFQDTFLSLASPVNFSQFAFDVKYSKNFDTHETLTGDIWTQDHLGTPKSVLVEKTDWIKLRQGEPGDSESNPADINFALKQFLTIDTKIIHTENLTGLLHFKIPQFDTGVKTNCQIVYISEDKEYFAEFNDLSVEHDEYITSFKPGDYLVIIIDDPRWDIDLAHTLNSATGKVWISNPCGGLPGEVIEVSTAEELINATESLGPGNTIRIAPGTYSLEYHNVPALGFSVSLWVNGQVLVGAGRDETILEAYWITVRGGEKASLRDLTIRGTSRDPFDIIEVPDFSICNVKVVDDVDPLFYGVYFRPKYNFITTRSYSRYFFTIIGCNITTHPYPLQVGTTGIYISGCDSTNSNCMIEGKPVQFDLVMLTVEDTQISGFKYGIDGYFCPVQIDCKDIYGPWGRVRSNAIECSGEKCN